MILFSPNNQAHPRRLWNSKGDDNDDNEYLHSSFLGLIGTRESLREEVVLLVLGLGIPDVQSDWQLSRTCNLKHLNQVAHQDHKRLTTCEKGRETKTTAAKPHSRVRGNYSSLTVRRFHNPPLTVSTHRISSFVPAVFFLIVTGDSFIPHNLCDLPWTVPLASQRARQKGVTDDCPAIEAIECCHQFTFFINFTAIIAVQALLKPPTLASPQGFLQHSATYCTFLCLAVVTEAGTQNEAGSEFIMSSVLRIWVAAW